MAAKGCKMSILVAAVVFVSSVNCQVNTVVVRFGDDNAGNITTVVNTFDTIRWEFVNGFHEIVTPNLRSNDADFFDSGGARDARNARIGEPGTVFEQTFRSGATEIFYQCDIHPNIHFGTIIVQNRDNGGATTLPSLYMLCAVSLALSVSLLVSS